MHRFKIVGFDSTERDALVLEPESFRSAIAVVECEIHDFANPFKIVRFDVYDNAGLIYRRNVAHQP